MSKLTKREIQVKLQAISSNEQIEQPSEEALDEAFLTLVYNAHKQTSDENSEPFDIEAAYNVGIDDGQITYARWVLESLFGINLDMLKKILS